MNLMRKGRESVLKTWIFDSLPKLCPRECDEWGAICWLPQIKEMRCQLLHQQCSKENCHDRNRVAHTTVDARDVKRGIRERRGRSAAHLLAAAALSRLGAIDRPCLVHVLGCGIFEIDFGNLGLVTVGPFFRVLASTAGWGGSGQWLRVLIVDWWSTFVER